MTRVPVIDLGPAFSGDSGARLRVAGEIDAACRSLGFLVVSGHGVPDSLIQEARTAAGKFFDLPEAEKLKIAVTEDTYRGYIPMASESLSNSLDTPAPVDLKEVFHIGATTPPEKARADSFGASFFMENVWPAPVPELRPVFETYYGAMSNLARELMRLFALGLDLPETYFDDKIDHHISNMAALRYPPLASAPLPGQFRAGAHSDYGSLTILQRDETPGGLEVLSGESWIPVPDIPGSFVINLGDLMEDWTGGAWKSTMHRVVPPPDLGGSDRLSIAFFHQPNYDTMIVPLDLDNAVSRDYEPVTSGEHVRMKISKHRAVDAGVTA